MSSNKRSMNVVCGGYMLNCITMRLITKSFGDRFRTALPIGASRIANSDASLSVSSNSYVINVNIYLYLSNCSLAQPYISRLVGF